MTYSELKLFLGEFADLMDKHGVERLEVIENDSVLGNPVGGIRVVEKREDAEVYSAFFCTLPSDIDARNLRNFVKDLT